MQRKTKGRWIAIASLLVTLELAALLSTSVFLVKAQAYVYVSNQDTDWDGTLRTVQFIGLDATNGATINSGTWDSLPFLFDFPLVDVDGTWRIRTGILNPRERVWKNGYLVLDTGYWQQIGSDGGAFGEKSGCVFDTMVTTNPSTNKMRTIWTKTLYSGMGWRAGIILQRDLYPLSIPGAYEMEYTISYGYYSDNNPSNPLNPIGNPLGDIATGILWHYSYSQESSSFGPFAGDTSADGSLECMQDRITGLAGLLKYTSTVTHGMKQPGISFQLSYTYDDSVKDASKLHHSSYTSNQGKAVIGWDGNNYMEFSNPNTGGPNIGYDSSSFAPDYGPDSRLGEQPSMVLMGMVYPNAPWTTPVLEIDQGIWLGQMPTGTWSYVGVGPTGNEYQRVYVNYTYFNPAKVHDVAVGASATKTVTWPGAPTSIGVAITNTGDYDETCNVTLEAEEAAIWREKIGSYLVPVGSGNCTILDFAWNTTGCTCGNCTIDAYVTPVPGETDTSDNNFTMPMTLSIPGDINGDFKVDILDAIILSNSFGKSIGETSFNPNADINGDNIVNILDAIIMANHFGQHYP